MRDLVDELLQAKVKTKLFGGDHAPKLGRLVLLDRIGSGAMGTVFAAYDPKLERKVAIKVLTTADGRQRVLAEARALARLAHPNVVTVHDADEADGMVFIVMELAPGVPLRAWTAGGRRDWREVVRAMREAGAGIAAAHAAGLVHRDIKPDNILIGDDRARVVDFGLAQTGDDGHSAGTPSYMAPEVLAGEPVTTASDQFSFGVTLYEALYGARPHGAAEAAASTEQADGPKAAPNRATLRDLALSASQAAPPAGTRVPGWVHAVVARALAPDPARRFGAMTEVVAALSRDRRRMRFATIVAATAVVGAGLGALTVHHTAGNPCNDAAQHRATAWNEATRAGVRAGLGGVPWTAKTVAALDDASARWEASYTKVCEATRVHGSQSDALLELRMRCLDRVLDRFGALVTALSGSHDGKANPDAPSGRTTATLDAAARAAAPSAIAELPPAEPCEVLADPAELALPADRVRRDAALAAERAIDRGWTAFALGRYADARSIASTAQAGLADAPAIRASALVLAAAIEARIGAPADARAKLQAALDASASASAAGLELDVWARLLRSELFAGSPAHVVEWAPFARAAAARAGRQGAEIDGIVAEALRDAGRLHEARALLEHALASTDPLRPDQRSILELNLASIELAAGDSAEAVPLLERARDRVVGAFGDRHPDLALYDDKLADAAAARGRIREAMKLHARSLELRAAAFGDDDRAVATGLYHRARTELEAGELDNATRDLERARAIRARVFGATSPRLGEVDAAIADVAAARGLLPAARDTYAHAAQLDPRLDLAARRAAAGADVSPHEIAPYDPAETLTADRVTALIAHHALLLRKLVPGDLGEVSFAIAKRYRPELDPPLAVAIGRMASMTYSGAGPGRATADMFATALAHAGDEPTRTALAAAIGLARCDDPRAPQAARTAIALYQAMPQLGRDASYDDMWKLSKR